MVYSQDGKQEHVEPHYRHPTNGSNQQDLEVKEAPKAQESMLVPDLGD